MEAGESRTPPETTIGRIGGFDPRYQKRQGIGGRLKVLVSHRIDYLFLAYSEDTKRADGRDVPLSGGVQRPQMLSSTEIVNQPLAILQLAYPPYRVPPPQVGIRSCPWADSSCRSHDTAMGRPPLAAEAHPPLGVCLGLTVGHHLELRLDAGTLVPRISRLVSGWIRRSSVAPAAQTWPPS